MSEETHTACNARLAAEGGKARCCYCVPHDGCLFTDLDKLVDDSTVYVEVDGERERVNYPRIITFEEELSRLMAVHREELIRELESIEAAAAKGESRRKFVLARIEELRRLKDETL